MRAPQYGHSKGKRRGNQAPMGLGSQYPLKPRLWRAVGLRHPNEPLPTRRIRYQPRKDVMYEGGTYGAPCTLSLHHKGADWDNGVKVGGEGPTVTKQYAVVRTSHRQRV